jgi:hypothetical protein
MRVAGDGNTRGARELLAGLVGQPLETLSGRWNSILELRDTHALVATGRSPVGTPVSIALVEEALDQLNAEGELRIDVPTVGYRSAFVGAVLQKLPGTRIEQNPQRIVLGERTAEWDVGVGGLLSRAERVRRFGGAPYGELSHPDRLGMSSSTAIQSRARPTAIPMMAGPTMANCSSTPERGPWAISR